MSELRQILLRQLSRVRQHYEQAEATMRTLPLANPNLTVRALPQGWVNLRSDEVSGQALLAGIIAPWCINALLLPLVWPLSWPHHTGGEVTVTLPGGEFVFLTSDAGFLSLSLLSEPRTLADQPAAEVFLKEALRLLAQSDAEEASDESGPTASRGLSRRGLLGVS